MKKRYRYFSILLIMSIFVVNAMAQSDEFKYQGFLKLSGQPANGTYDFQFSVFSSSVGGTQFGNTIDAESIQVTNGTFAVSLLFEDAFNGQTRYLEIKVRPSGGGAYTTLSPRELIGTTPYAMRSTYAYQAQNAVNAEFAIESQHALNADTAGSAISAGNVSGIVSTSNGGTGSAGQNFVDLSTQQIIGGNKSFTGILGGNGSGLTNVPGTVVWQNFTGTGIQALPNRGYVANNVGQVTITLPTAPNIGDTIRVSGAGLGGWKIAQNAGQTILVQNLVALGSGDWTPRETNREWVAVASSANGVKLVAAVGFGLVYTSADSGATWIPRETSRSWRSVASSADGNKLVAVVEDGKIYTSIDSGATWTPRENNRGWTDVASSSNGTKLVAVVGVGQIEGGQIYASVDSGVTWVPRETNRWWKSVASSADGSKLVAVVDGGQIYTSIDSGVNWTPRETNRNWYSVASSADGTKVLAGTLFGLLYHSIDSGANWSPIQLTGNWSVASSANGNNLVAVSDGGRIYTSSNSGLAWQGSDSDRAWRSVASSDDGLRMVAVVLGGRIYTSSPSTTTGVLGFLTGGHQSAVELQYIGNGQFIPLTSTGIISVF